MKLRNLSVAASLTLAILVLSALQAWAQSYQVIYNFSGGSDGGNPIAGLTLHSSGITP